ncbi:TIGR03619 family F420-dependent LLM class oxidoreductase [Streptomyces fractus]|uniref:TIGR03619 family F420-dependent LLM class oxidoreductase n=1 Tax=Streptomyces fractus TaxID=641806 RepID=UPI003CF2DD50
MPRYIEREQATVEFGIGFYPTHDSIHPATLARMVEERAHNTSLFLAEHSHVPAVAYEEREVPRRLSHLYDPFVALTAAVSATSRLRVGTGICLVAERDPITTAKQVASLDHLSGGRFEFGIGSGWLRPAMVNHGIDPRTRLRRMGEYVGAMKEIWTQEEASFDGEFVQFERIRAWPKPVQRPNPPIYVGGDGPTVFDRVLGYADGWLPNFARDPREGQEILDRVEQLRARADRSVDVVVVSVPPDPSVLERLAKGGVRRAVHWLPATGPAGVERELDRWEAAVTEMTGEAETVHKSTAETMGERMELAAS